MCVVLLPRVGYARVTNSGLVILKRHWWSLFRKRLPVTDVVIKHLPIEIGKLICKKNKRDVYISMFNDKVATIISLVKYTEKMDLLDYVYREYAKACLLEDPAFMVETYTEPIPAKVHSFNIITVFKSMKPKKQKITISDKIEKLKSRIALPHKLKFLLTKVEVATA